MGTFESDDHSEGFPDGMISESLRESLKNLVEFKICIQNFDENLVCYHTIFSVDIGEALGFAIHHLQTTDWHIESVTRVWDQAFFDSLPGNLRAKAQLDETFWAIVGDLEVPDINDEES